MRKLLYLAAFFPPAIFAQSAPPNQGSVPLSSIEPIDANTLVCNSNSSRASPSACANPTASGIALRTTGVFTNMQFNDPVTSLLNGASVESEHQDTGGNTYTTDAIAGAVIAPEISSVTQADGLAGYAATLSTGTAAFGVYAQGRCNADARGANCFGADFVVTNRATGSGQPTFVPAVLYGLETDVDPGDPQDSATGIMSLLNSNILTNYVGSAAFLAGGNNRSSGNKWNVGYQTQDMGANLVMDGGATCTSGSCGSQEIQLDYYSDGARNNVALYADSSGNLDAPPLTVGSGFAIMTTGVTCSMSSGSSCTVSLPAGSGHCAAYAQGSSAYYAACSVNGMTATVTANASNSATWLVIATQ